MAGEALVSYHAAFTMVELVLAVLPSSRLHIPQQAPRAAGMNCKHKHFGNDGSGGGA